MNLKIFFDAKMSGHQSFEISKLRKNTFSKIKFQRNYIFSNYNNFK